MILFSVHYGTHNRGYSDTENIVIMVKLLLAVKHGEMREI